VKYDSEIASHLIVEIFQIVRSEHMTAEGVPVAETSTNQIIDSLPVSVLPMNKKMKGREECELLEKVLLAFQVQVLK
jgi:hypothetical protein